MDEVPLFASAAAANACHVPVIFYMDQMLVSASLPLTMEDDGHHPLASPLMDIHAIRLGPARSEACKAQHEHRHLVASCGVGMSGGRNTFVCPSLKRAAERFPCA